MVNIDKNLSYKRESHESAFTILLWDVSKENLINELKHKLNSISKIKNNFVKSKLNDRLFDFLVQIENSSIETYNQVILIGNETYTYKLDKSDINILKEFSIPKLTIQNNENFNIDWLTDLFENFNFYDIVINNSNTFTHWKGNLNKKKIVTQTTSIEYIKNLNIPFYMVGKLLPQNKNKLIIEHFITNSPWNELIKQIENLQMKKKINVLQEQLDKMLLDKETDKFIFGNEIYEMIEQYNIKELYININKKKEFDEIILNKNLIDNINFTIIIIESIDKNIDASSILFNNYGGFLGIKYY